MVRETRLTPQAFVYPLFVCPGQGVRKAIASMPGVFNLSIDLAVEEARETYSLGIPAVILFGLPEKKDEQASGAWAEDGIVQRATRAIKRAIPDLVIIGDVCLCEYMSHGHCGIVKKAERVETARSGHSGAAAVASRVEQYEIENDATLEILPVVGLGTHFLDGSEFDGPGIIRFLGTGSDVDFDGFTSVIVRSKIG